MYRVFRLYDRLKVCQVKVQYLEKSVAFIFETISLKRFGPILEHFGNILGSISVMYNIQMTCIYLNVVDLEYFYANDETHRNWANRTEVTLCK